jgi:hypothetical protein
MFKEIKINFFDFFNISKKSLLENKRKHVKNFSEDNHDLYSIIRKLRKEDDAFIIFKNINYENIFELRDISKLKAINRNPIRIYDIIEKDKIIKNIPKIFKLIKEYGLDYEWYQHIENLKKRLSVKEVKMEDERLTDYTKNIISLGFSLTPSKSHNNSSRKSILSNKSNDNSNKNLINYSSNKKIQIYMNIHI